MAVGDIYQMTVAGDIFNEVILNVYYYRVASGAGLAQDVIDEWVLSVWADAMVPMIVGQYSINQIRAVNGMDNDDNAIDDVSLDGTSLSGLTPLNVAGGFRQRTGGIGYRYSYKRFAGWGSGIGSGTGTWDKGPDDAGVIDVATALGALLEGAEGSYEPIQVTGGFLLGVSPTFKQVLSGIWQYNLQPSHQDTRQRYSWSVPA